MPTVSASQAFLSDNKRDDTNISFGLPRLDALLSEQHAQVTVVTTTQYAPKGIARGKITEIYGPPGAGKTALWLVQDGSVQDLNKMYAEYHQVYRQQPMHYKLGIELSG